MLPAPPIASAGPRPNSNKRLASKTWAGGSDEALATPAVAERSTHEPQAAPRKRAALSFDEQPAGAAAGAAPATDADLCSTAATATGGASASGAAATEHPPSPSRREHAGATRPEQVQRDLTFEFVLPAGVRPGETFQLNCNLKDVAGHAESVTVPVPVRFPVGSVAGQTAQVQFSDVKQLMVTAEHSGMPRHAPLASQEPVQLVDWTCERCEHLWCASLSTITLLHIFDSCFLPRLGVCCLCCQCWTLLAT